MTAHLIPIPNMKSVYQYKRLDGDKYVEYFETTELNNPRSPGWIAVFEVSDEEADMNSKGGLLVVQNGSLKIIDENEGMAVEVADVLEEQPEEPLEEPLA